jgi:ADP-heptose:LPS heptosyltransferase
VRTFPYLEWLGQSGMDQRLLVHAEQGLGDIILFSSCLPDLHQRCSDVLLEVPSRMQSLFARSFPWAEVIGHEPGDNAMGWLGQGRPVERQVAIGSLPRWLRNHDEDFRATSPFLRADPDRVLAWRERLKVQPGQTVIGITWRGGLAFTGKTQRSLPLADLASTLARTGARLVSLQHGDTQADLQRCADETGVVIESGLSGYADLDDLAALTQACDGIVSVCSTQAHLTGALGQKGLILVPHGANWRYGASGSRMVWYPGLELSRQSVADDWSTPIARAQVWVEDRTRDASGDRIS